MKRQHLPLHSRLRTRLFRFIHRNNNKIQIGSNLVLHCWLSIKGPGHVHIGDDCVVSALPGHSSYMVTLYTTTADAVISIGNHVSLVSARFSSRFEISVGDGVLIEDASVMDTDFHSLDIDRGVPGDEIKKTCRVCIERNVRIGSRAIITKGVSLGEGTHVYPGAIVQKSCEAQTLLLGNPAKPYSLGAPVWTATMPSSVLIKQ